MPRTRKNKTAESSGTETRSRHDALAVLKSDHAEVKRLLKQLNDSADKESRDLEELLGEIEVKLKTHTEMEEEIFYPAFKDAIEENDQHLYFEALEEHGLVDTVLPELQDTEVGTPEFKAKAKVLLDLIEHHVEEEEGEMFTKARSSMSAEELRELGKRMAEFKGESVETDEADEVSEAQEMDEDESEESDGRHRRGHSAA